MEQKAPSHYDHHAIEKKWQEQWSTDGLYRVSDCVDGKENFFELVEFTYPSGNLHVGHWYAYSVPDIHARFKRMQGYNVLYPIGFDAFGLPAENAAIKLGADPKVLTYEQMEKMRMQLRSMGAMFDWEREVVSCNPAYYRWTQWMFNQFLKKDLVYRAITTVNWCPNDKTVLANEQVNDGTCDRCGTEVVQREQPQWMLRITAYADRLVDDLNALQWPEEIKAAQRNWIGRSEGSELTFKLSTGDEATVFTTRADTLFGVTYIVLAPEHALVADLLSHIENKEEVQEYIAATKKKLELERQQSKEKTGVQLKGITAVNPANSEEIPVWIADYVLAGYGTGAVMAVPAHDERDFEFANKYGLPRRHVVAVQHEGKGSFAFRDGVETLKRRCVVIALENKKGEIMTIIEPDTTTLIGGGIEEGETPEQAALREITEETGYTDVTLTGRIVDHFFANGFRHTKEKNVDTDDYVFTAVLNSEERVPCEVETGAHTLAWVTKENMAKAIPEVHHHTKTWNLILRPLFEEEGLLVESGTFSGLTSKEAKQKITEAVGGKMVNTYRLRDWGISRQRYWGTPIPIVYDPEGKAHPVPDEHLPWLLPTDVDHTPDGTAPLARSKELLERTEALFGKGWTPEVETMDTFVDSSWYFYRYLDNKNESAFADKKNLSVWMPIDLYMGGAEHTTMHLLYSRFWVKALCDLGLVTDDEAYKVRRNRGLILGPDGNKMSKSKGNVIDPDEIVERLGADTVRMYLAFMGPYGVTTNYPWDPNGVVGVRRFLERVWRLQGKIDVDKKVCRTDALVHKTVKGVGDDIEAFKFNTAIAKMMILVNALEKEEKIVEGSYLLLLRLLAPFAPHVAEELWAVRGQSASIHVSAWPAFNEALLIDDTVVVGVQINGKVRAELSLPVEASKEDIEAAALALPRVQELLEGKEPKKIIVVAGRVVNIVV